MNLRLNQDTVGGLLLVILGAFVVYHTTTAYPLGTLGQMGPGLFPAALGGIMLFFGALITVLGYPRDATVIRIEVRVCILILLSLAIFAVLAPLVGMVPAVIALSITASLADPNANPLSMIVVALVVAAVAYAVFGLGLSIQLRPFLWPF